MSLVRLVEGVAGTTFVIVRGTSGIAFSRPSHASTVSQPVLARSASDQDTLDIWQGTIEISRGKARTKKANKRVSAVADIDFFSQLENERQFITTGGETGVTASVRQSQSFRRSRPLIDGDSE